MTEQRPQLAAQIERATKRLTQLKAREFLRNQQAKTKAKGEVRRADAHRKIELGGLVIAAGLKDWDCAELVGALLDAADRASHSPTVRLGLRKRGLNYLDARKAARQRTHYPGEMGRSD
ncbi:MAG: conjugal transfer protein TraD [Dokdonella sp.]